MATPRRSSNSSDDRPRESERFRSLIERIDQLNREDPHHEVVDGVASPCQLLYSERLTAWVLRLDPAASEPLRIAARGQHICRWMIPRQRYEPNRRGYLRWREVLKAFHARKVAELMREAGYPEQTIQRVEVIMGKRRLPDDPETQTLEDALCLVFLETQFRDLREKTPTGTMLEVLRKTWRKMSAQGRAHALQLPLAEDERSLIAQAL